MRYKIASEAVVGKVLDGEAVIINLATGIYYSTDGLGAIVWELAENGAGKAEILAAVTQAYPTANTGSLDLLLESFVNAELISEISGDSNSDAFGAVIWPSDYAAPELQAYDDVADMVALDPPLPEMQFQR